MIAATLLAGAVLAAGAVGGVMALRSNQQQATGPVSTVVPGPNDPTLPTLPTNGAAPAPSTTASAPAGPATTTTVPASPPAAAVTDIGRALSDGDADALRPLLDESLQPQAADIASQGVPDGANVEFDMASVRPLAPGLATVTATVTGQPPTTAVVRWNGDRWVLLGTTTEQVPQ